MSTESVSKFIVDTNYEQIEPEVMRIAKNAILDFLGVALAGTLDTGSVLVTEYAKEMNSKPEAGIIGSRLKASAPIAALANGTMAHILEYDDYCYSWGHPTVPILPAVLALGQRYQCSGKDVLEAYLIGLEVGSKIGNLIGKRLRLAGWHNVGVIGSLAAAAASARLIRLNIEQTRIALGISASLSGGLAQNFGTMTKSLHAGSSARNGVMASLLAKKGFTADKDILEGEQGFCKVFGCGTNWESSTKWGSPWGITETGFKPYPSCRGTHAAIDAALILRDKYHFNPEYIAEVECIIGPMQSQVLLYRHPNTSLEAKFSVEYCVSIALFEGKVKLEHFTDEKLSEPQIQQFLRKVKRVVHSGLEDPILEYPQTVIVRLRDGREFSQKVTYDETKGNPQNPMDFEEICSKYRNCAELVLKRENVERSLALISSLESLEDISVLMDIVTFGVR